MSHPDQFALLGQKRFAPFFWTQFLGAFNDNVYKNALIILGTFHAAEMTSLDATTLANLASGLFILPYFLFSATSGQIADKYEKSRLIRFVKLFEIAIMVVGSIGFVMRSLPMLLLALFMLGTHSTLFGPVKYAILPQHLRDDELVGGNGLVEMGTFVAILLGTILGSLLIAIDGSGPLLASAAVILIALAGYMTSRGVPHSPAAASDLRINWNPFSETWRNLKFAKQSRTVFLSLLGNSWFWFFGATVLTQLPHYSKDVLHGNEQVYTLLLTLFSIGIGTGSLLCEKLSSGKIEIGLVPFGSIGMTVFGALLCFATPSTPASEAMSALQFLSHGESWWLLFNLVMLGVFGGFYIVPLYALIQTRSAPSHRSRIIAANNILNALFVVISAAFSILLLGKLGLSVAQLFLVTALLNAAVAAYIFTLVPEFLMRFIVWIWVHTFYRLKKTNLEQIPEEGPALLVCNHVSYVDALVIFAGCPRPVRFVMDHKIFRIPILSFIFRTLRAIPIASRKEDPAITERAFEEVDKALQEGDVVCIFPEGKITATGEINPFRPGITRILERRSVPVIPLALRGLWGSFFSRKTGTALRLPRRILSRIELIAAAPVLASLATPQYLQEIVTQLRADWR
jgi:1-acyl-sn-glycerol-3-phosphate acyltransferase